MHLTLDSAQVLQLSSHFSKWIIISLKEKFHTASDLVDSVILGAKLAKRAVTESIDNDMYFDNLTHCIRHLSQVGDLIEDEPRVARGTDLSPRARAASNRALVTDSVL